MVKWGRRVWPGLALVITVTGVLLVALSVPVLASQVIAREEILFDNDFVEIGPYHLEAGDYSVWIEDYFPGFDDGGRFGVAIIRDDADFDTGWTWGTYETRTIDGVACEHAGGFDNVREGDYTFDIYLIGNITDDSIRVFVVREYNYIPSIMFGIGVVCISLGLIVTGLILLGRGKRDRREHKA